MIADTIVSGEIELDEKYVLNSHKGEKINNLKSRKRGGSASRRDCQMNRSVYNRLLSTKHCKIRGMKDYTAYTSLDHLSNVNAFHRLIEKWYKGYIGVASKYINGYAALFTLVREYTGCDTQEILLSIKKRMHQITDSFRIVGMKKDNLFIYSIS